MIQVTPHCMAHSRRKYVDVADAFPEKCLHILTILGEVFHFDGTSENDWRKSREPRKNRTDRW